MVTWVVDPGLIRPFVPTGTEIALYKGDALVTLSAVDIQDATWWGRRVPWHSRFPMLNLQCYVRQHILGSRSARDPSADPMDNVRHGVTLIHSLTSRRLVALATRMRLREAVRTLPMRRIAVPETPSDPIAADAQRSLVYEWQRDGEWERIIALTVGAPRPMRRDSVESFITERPWRFARQRHEAPVGFRVVHTRWNISLLADCLIEVDLASLFGPHFTDALSGAPISTLVAEGSPVDVYHASPLEQL